MVLWKSNKPKLPVDPTGRYGYKLVYTPVATPQAKKSPVPSNGSKTSSSTRTGSTSSTGSTTSQITTPATSIINYKDFENLDSLWTPGFAASDIKVFEFAPRTLFCPAELIPLEYQNESGKYIRGRAQYLQKQIGVKQDPVKLMKNQCLTIWRRNIDPITKVSFDDCLDTSISVWQPTYHEFYPLLKEIERRRKLCKIWSKEENRRYFTSFSRDLMPWSALLYYEKKSKFTTQLVDCAKIIHDLEHKEVPCDTKFNVMYRGEEYTLLYEGLLLSMIQIFLKHDLIKMGPTRARLVAATIFAAGHGMMGYDLIADPDSCNRMDLFKCVWIWSVAIQVSANSLAGKHIVSMKDYNPYKYEGTLSFDLEHWTTLRKLYNIMLDKRHHQSSRLMKSMRSKYDQDGEAGVIRVNADDWDED